ncbi:conserved domain protein [Mycoplasmoides pneumoniae FH]|uniref:Conserved domain protein n=1 Tax=Mycoplasmoides pneumoniae (strain ATCC 15531 / DSM 23978 / CIP 103766 / NBRC 14401 / NCTC 10119 / FH) TaxID=722438 RepID=A0A0H3DMT6_MYCPB|nr:hypothetical protein [Mycoplasmoides pneumoniae]ADK87071.1 conserved domain protein [Mycoplasmoides pneumoniae FH]
MPIVSFANFFLREAAFLLIIQPMAVAPKANTPAIADKDQVNIWLVLALV